MREIITQQDIQSGARESAEQPKADRYVDRLMKLIPGEVVALYVLLDGSIKNSPEGVPRNPLLWAVFLFLVVGTWIYLRRVQNVTKRTSLILSTVAFVIWVFYLGGPFASMAWYNPFYGQILLPLYTFSVGLIEPKG